MHIKITKVNNMNNKLNANKILDVITSKMYYDEMGNIKSNLGISEITYKSDKNVIKLEDGRSFSIIVEVE